MKNLVLCLLFVGFLAPAPARAEYVGAPPFLDWFVQHLARVLSELGLDEAQKPRVDAAKRPLTLIIDAVVEAERTRARRMRALFNAKEMTIDDWKRVTAARRNTEKDLRKKLRHETRVFLVELHKILRDVQRGKVVDLWASRVERRSFQYERPLQ